MTDVTTWTDQRAEQAAIAVMQELIGNLTELIHSVPEARYLDPAGGFDVTS